MRRTGIIAVICSALVGLNTLLSAPNALAFVATCDSPASNYFRGYYHDTHVRTENFEGASANMRNRFGGVCNTDSSGPDPTNPNTNFSNFTTSWVMIADYDGSHYAQAGVIRGYNTPQYLFAEFTNVATGGPIDRYPGSPSVSDGSLYAYYAVYTPTCGCTQMKVGSTVITQTNYNPFQYWSYGPNPSTPKWSPQYSTEKSYQANDTMGVPTQHVQFASLGAQQYWNDAIVAEPCTLSLVTSSSRSTSSAASCTAFDVWRTS